MRTVRYINGCIITPWGCVERGTLITRGERIAIISEGGGTRIPLEADETVDLEGDYLAPGFLDIHVHGGGGGDFMDGTQDSFRKAMETHLAHGTTGLCPTTLTATMEELKQVFGQSAAMRRLAENPKEGLPGILGVHMEGPYIAESMKGAQDAEFIRDPRDGSFRQILEMAAGELKIWTAAPELPGASAFAAEARRAGVLLSVGHSDARIEEVEQAARDGYTMATHLYSSMSTIIRENGCRRPGVLEASLLMDALDVEVIADGMHLPASLLQLIVKTKGVEHIILVTDAMRGAGMGPGRYRLGSQKNGQEVISDGEIARLQDGISFAGSVATADRLIRVMNEQGQVPLWQAVRMMTYNPARALGEREIGSLETGKYADMVRFAPGVKVKEVYRRGRLVCKAGRKQEAGE